MADKDKQKENYDKFKQQRPEKDPKGDKGKNNSDKKK